MTYSELRASDAERERVVAFLREHALLGRLTDDELEDRIGLAYASVTVGDLEKLIGDLPRANQPSRRPSAPRSHPTTRRRQASPPPALLGHSIGALLVGSLGVMAAVVVVGVAVALVATAFVLGMALGPFLLVALLIVALSKRHHRHHQHRRPSARFARPQY